ncbi:MAG TPA: thermopsin family protease [Thermoplasmata archaeon]|nr:thermopsin family protease [Thermoplasmata archaeon]
MLSGLPPTLRNVPWIESLAREGPALSPLTSLPNLALLMHPATATTGSVNPFYVAEPAPLGLTDFGLGVKTYSYNTSHILGEVTFYTPPNVTDPASTHVTEVSGQHLGEVGSLNEFGIQLNTVATNISIPGSDKGFFWTQNVLNYNDTGIHFVSDTFNLTSATHNPFYIAPGTIYSACNNGSAGVQEILDVYGGVLQCVGGTIPVSPTSYPVTVQLYNNATTNAQKRSVVSYGYRIIEAGTGQVFTGISDQVVFNASRAHPRPPGFSIDGFALTPTGLFRDAEIVLVGNIGGDNSVFRSISGTMQLEYSNATHGGFRSVPSAYNWGGDTGETAAGIADYWTPSHTLVFHQGPTMLYGLWGAEPYVSVKSGFIHFAGSITPSYGFVFVSNTPPVLDPWNTTLNERDNMSWLPTTDAGKFDTYLPPLGAPWTTSYYVQAFAAGFQELNGTTVTGTDTSYHLSLTPAPGSLRAPLYAFSNSQFVSLTQNVTGVKAPFFFFDDLVVNMNFTFEHVNDYGYATFEVFMTVGVTVPFTVAEVYQGLDSSGGNFVFADYASPPEQGLLAPAPTFYTLFYWTSGINIFDGAHAEVANQVTDELDSNIQIVLWHDKDVIVDDVTSELSSAGVWVGDSVKTQVENVLAEYASTGVTDMGSSHTSVSDVEAVGSFSTGVVSLSSSDGTYSTITAEEGAYGVASGADYGFGVGFDPYYYLPGSTGTTVDVVVATQGSVGVNATLSYDTTIVGVTAISVSVGVEVDGSLATQIYGVEGEVTSSIAVYLHNVSKAYVEEITAFNDSIGVQVVASNNVTIQSVLADNYSIGVYLEASTHVIIHDVKARDHSIRIKVVP